MNGESGYWVVVRPTDDDEEFDFYCRYTAEVRGDVGFADDRGKYCVETALHYGVSDDRYCFVMDFKLIDRACWKVVQELRQRFDTLDHARAAIESYDPREYLPTDSGDAVNPDVRRKLSTHYRSQKVAWDREIDGLFAGVF